MVSDVVILPGGRGTRLSRVVNDRAKPMALVAGRPFLEWLLLRLHSQGARRVVLATSYMEESVRNYF